MSKEQSNPILGAIDNINSAFEEFKKTNDERLDAESKGNDARARELTEKLDKIEVDIAAAEKRKREEERKEAITQERIEILESANDRPKASIEDKIKNEYSEHFFKYLRSAFTDQEAGQAMKEVREKALQMKSVNILTGAAGGHAVPEEISRSIDKLMLRQSDVLQNVKMVQVGSSDYKELITINSSSAAWIAETTSRTEQTTPELRQVAPTWGELYSYLFATEWALQDTFFNVEDWLVDNVSEQMAKTVDLAIWSGDGSNKPTGLTNTTPVSTADTASPIRAAAALQYIPTDAASPQAFGGDDVFDLVYSLNRAYRPNAKFGANQNTQAAIRKLKDTTNQYLWEPSLQAGQPARLVGYELFTYEDMGDPTTGDALYLGFGDWRKAYTLPFRQQLAITVDNNITAPGFVKFYVRRRYGGIVANNDALKLLKLADT
jgi:HK97 family phage major capsid protein